MKIFIQIWGWYWTFSFIAFAAVQYNDPDPEIWATWYMIAAILSALAIRKQPHFLFYLVFALVSFIWAYFQWPAIFEGFEQTVPHNMHIEEARETGGLLIAGFIAAVTGILLVLREKKFRN